MALTVQDKIECKDIAREIMEHVMSNHIQTCPHGQLIARSKALLIGCVLGSGLVSGIGGGGIIWVLLETFTKASEVIH